MSESHESESMKAARNSPPLPHERTLASDGPGIGTIIGVGLPLLLSVGGAIAAGTAVEKKNRGVSRAAGRAKDEADSWYETLADKAGDVGESIVDHGAKLAGVTGLLSALGSGGLSSAAATAAKALTAKKVAEYAAGAGASATKSAGRFVKEHPGLTAAGSAAALKARGYVEEGTSRARDAYERVRYGRKPEPESHVVDNIATGLAVVGVGAAAMYLFHPDQGRHRRRVLRESLFGAGQRTARQSKQMLHEIQKQTAHYAKVASEQAESAVDAAKTALSSDDEPKAG